MFRQRFKAKDVKAFIQQASCGFKTAATAESKIVLAASRPSQPLQSQNQLTTRAFFQSKGIHESYARHKEAWKSWCFVSERQYVSHLRKRSHPAPLTELPLQPLDSRSSVRRIVNCFLFCTGLSASAFFVTALWEEHVLRKEWRLWENRLLPHRELVPNWIQRTPIMIQNLYREFWLDVSREQRVVGVITAANLAIYAALNSRSARLLAFMDKYFLHHLPPLPNKVITLCTANFAHKSFGHLAFNSIALWSFGTEAARDLGASQFLAFYLSAGLASALTSDLGRVTSKIRGMSLGASGAIYACFALVSILKPDLQVSIIIFPWLSFNAADALSCMMGLDILGVLFGWKSFDHYGHLGGAFFGLYYAMYGREDVWPKIEAFAEQCWDKLGGEP